MADLLCAACEFTQVFPGGVDVKISVLPGQLWTKVRGRARRWPWVIDLDANTIRISGAGGTAKVVRRTAAAVQRATEAYGGRELGREAWLAQFKKFALVPVIGVISAKGAA